MPSPAVRTDRAALARRIGVLALCALFWSALMGYRLFDLQVSRAEEMRSAARRQQQRVLSLDARRGLLYDRNGGVLAMSVEVDSIYAAPSEIEDPAGTAAALAPLLDGDSSAKAYSIRALAEKLTGDRGFVWVRRKVDPSLRRRVESLALKGIGFVREHRRFYPHGGLAAHVLGWVGMDNKGMDGLELSLDERIRGRDGQVFALRDARGRKFLKATHREPMPGQSVVLSLDETIQYIAERELARAIDETGAVSGSAIVMEPATGDILALANHPTYNPNRPTDVEAESRKNRAIVDAYEPGSTFKVVTMATALEKGLLRPSELFDCQNGSIRVGRALIRDHKPFGILSAAQVLEQSSNVGAIKIGLRLAPRDFYDSMRRFGFGSRTGIELPGEARGLVREPKDWSGVSQATLSFGQELSVTPLQLVAAVAAIANDGVLQPPRLVLRRLDARDGAATELPSKEPVRVLEEGTVRALRQMMMTVVDEGTAKAARMPGYSIAGKTGTAQKIGPDGTYASGRYIASFVGFVPATRPRLSILVVLDEPRGSIYHGGDVAAPVFRRIALPSLRYLGVPPEEGRLLDELDDSTLAAAAHARRWVEPMPLDEKELRAERERHEKRRLLEEKRARRAARQAEAAGIELEGEPAMPVRVPLPPPDSAAAGDEVMVADLTGHTLRRAAGWLGNAGLGVRVLPPSDGDEDPEGDGVVIEQDPPPGFFLREGAPVALRLGRLEQARPDGTDRGGETHAGTAVGGPPAARVAPARRAFR